MLYEIEQSDLYGMNDGKISDPVLYLLNREIIQDDPQRARNVLQSAISEKQKLDKEIKSKFNILKMNEPQFVGSGFMKQNKGGFTNPPNKFKFVR
jgi:hypothetical protein